MAVGSRGEAAVIGLFCGHGIPCKLAESKAYDLDALALRFEVKFDVYCARSGNIAIEYFNPKSCKPSGINATIADIWLHVLTKPVSIWMTSVLTLREFIAKNSPHRTIDCGGDKNSSMYLYKKDIILPQVFTRIDELSKAELLAVLQIMKGVIAC